MSPDPPFEGGLRTGSAIPVPFDLSKVPSKTGIINLQHDISYKILAGLLDACSHHVDVMPLSSATTMSLLNGALSTWTSCLERRYGQLGRP